MSNDIDCAEGSMAKQHQQFNDGYLSRVRSGKVKVIGNDPEPQNTTTIIYMDHTSSRRR